jgi:hypothetical protein
MAQPHHFWRGHGKHNQSHSVDRWGPSPLSRMDRKGPSLSRMATLVVTIDMSMTGNDRL